MTTTVLIAARLSRLRKDDTQTSIERQDETATGYAEQAGYSVAATAADSGVSGSIDPFSRPELGPWLTEPARLAEYDEIVAASLDRLGRNARDLARLRDWAEDHGKRITVLSPRLHWPPSPDDFASPIVWDVLARLAEYELQMTRKRYADMRRYLIDSGYLVGKAPFGYVITTSGKHKTLVPDPQLAPYVQQMADRYLAGTTLTQIASWLESEGIPSPQGKPHWTETRISAILRNTVYVGRRRDAEGRTILKVPPILGHETWNAVQALLDKKARGKGVAPGNTALLTNVAECAKCGGPMYRYTSTKKRKDGTKHVIGYYRCHGNRGKSECRNSVRQGVLDSFVNSWFTEPDGPFADQEVIENVVTQGHGHEAELAENAADIRDLDPDDPEYDARLAALRAERKRLQELPVVPDKIEERPTGTTVSETWQAMDTQQRRDYLIRAGVRVPVAGRDRYWITGDPHVVLRVVTR